MQFECDARNVSGKAVCPKHSAAFNRGEKILCDSGLVLWKGARAMRKKGKKVVFWAKRNGKRVKVCFQKKR
jgi:hypothetical protein